MGFHTFMLIWSLGCTPTLSNIRDKKRNLKTGQIYITIENKYETWEVYLEKWVYQWDCSIGWERERQRWENQDPGEDKTKKNLEQINLLNLISQWNYFIEKKREKQQKLWSSNKSDPLPERETLELIDALWNFGPN